MWPDRPWYYIPDTGEEWSETAPFRPCARVGAGPIPQLWCRRMSPDLTMVNVRGTASGGGWAVAGAFGPGDPARPVPRLAVPRSG